MIKYALILVIALISAFGGYWYCETSYLEAQNKLQKQLREKQAELDLQAVDLATAIGETKIEYVKINNEVIKYVETSSVDCFNDIAVELYNSTASR